MSGPVGLKCRIKSFADSATKRAASNDNGPGSLVFTPVTPRSRRACASIEEETLVASQPTRVSLSQRSAFGAVHGASKGTVSYIFDSAMTPAFAAAVSDWVQ